MSKPRLRCGRPLFLRFLVACLACVANVQEVGAADGPAAAAESTPVGLPTGFESRFADVGGVRIHYVIGGKGPALVLVHGWPETWYEWRKMLPRLSATHTVIAVDLRGFGQSAMASGGYDRKTLAADLHALMASLQVRNATLVGGIGAGVAQAMGRVASRVTPVLMADTGHFVPEERPEALAGIIDAFLEGQPIAPAWPVD